MELVIVYFVLSAGLFAGAFITKRRFGLLGLALAAGHLLSSIWGFDAGLVAGFFGFHSGPLTDAVVSSILVLLPAGLLLFHGYTYKGLVGRAVGAVMFTVLAIAFLSEPLSHVLVANGPAITVYNALLKYRMSIIGVGMIVAIVDLFLTKPALLSDKHRKH
jgi:hypothetical protein